MSPISRQRKKSKPKKHRVRSGDEVRARFGDRLAASANLLDAEWVEQGRPSFDQNRDQSIADGRIVVNDDGTEMVSLSKGAAAAFKLWYEMFRFKFGRKIGPHDPVFFDMDADHPTPALSDDAVDTHIAQIRQFAVEAGAADPDAVVEHFMGREELADYLKRRQS